MIQLRKYRTEGREKKSADFNRIYVRLLFGVVRRDMYSYARWCGRRAAYAHVKEPVANRGQRSLIGQSSVRIVSRLRGGVIVSEVTWENVVCYYPE